MRQFIPAKIKKVLFVKAGGKCSFPNCGTKLIDAEGNVLGEICHIEAFHEGGPRFSAERTQNDLFSESNLIFLCPNHHRLIDAQPFIYTADWLRKAKATHEKAIQQAIIATTEVEPTPVEHIKPVSFTKALDIWLQNESNKDEEFWQRFFMNNPRIIAQAVPEHIQIYDQKCYVGGKNVSNQGGNIVDFLYVTKPNNNVVLVEIKTPATRILGKKYRNNAYALTEDISGAIVQVLNYRDELLKNFYSLMRQNEEAQFDVFNPQCLIIAGNLNYELPNAKQRKSLELFRFSLINVRLITFDELFGKVKDLIDLSS